MSVPEIFHMRTETVKCSEKLVLFYIRRRIKPVNSNPECSSENSIKLVSIANYRMYSPVAHYDERMPYTPSPLYFLRIISKRISHLLLLLSGGLSP
jgi:hypothetical protein